MVSAAEKIDVPVRGKPLTLTIYAPRNTARGTILMGSGDVGWVGLAASNADEPSFAAKDVIATVSPVPLCMIQSTKDEYVPKAEWERLLATARDPKKQILVDASNHRFTDKRPELSAAYTAGLAWIAQAGPRRDR